MKVFGIAGWSGAGKTTLLVRLVPALVARGVEVATIKGTHHDLRFGGDEARALAEAGADEIMLASSERFALMGEGGRDLDDLLGRLAGVDLVLVEGFKGGDHPKLEVHDPALGKPLLAVADAGVVAVAADEPPPGLAVPCFSRGDAEGIALFILRNCNLQ